jgi:peptide/nickel transport system substrate-binding protein
MKSHKWLLWLVLGTFFAVMLTACGGGAAPVAEEEAAPAAAEEEAAPAEEEEAAPAEEEAAADKVLIAAWVQEFDTLNPLYTGMWFTSVTFEIWNCSPWVYDDNTEPMPVMVTEIPSEENGGISEDGLTITLHLRDDMTWQDGEPITSADFLFGYEMALDPGNAVASQYPFDQLESMEAPDDYTVVLTFAEPFAPWLAAFSYPIALPEHVLRPVFEAEGTIDAADWNLAPTVGCGPFQFEEWESGSYARFVAWDGYWMGVPGIDQIVFQFVPDDAAMIAALVNGDADLGTFFAYSDLPTLEAAGIAITSVNSGYNEGLFINMDPELQHPALADPNVRLAIAMGIDRETIVNDMLLGLTHVAVTPWEGSPAQDPALEAYPYDPDGAAALLDAAGWTDTDGDGIRDDGAGTPLTLRYGTNTRQIRQDVQAVVQQQLAEIGVGVDLLNYDSDIYFSTYGEGGPCSRGELDIFEYSGAYYFPDPDRVSFDCSEVPSDEYPDGSNDEHLCDPALDALFAQERTLVDPEARTQIFYQITDYMYDQVYWIGMWYDPDIWGVRDTVTGVRISGADPFFNVGEWDMP